MIRPAPALLLVLALLALPGCLAYGAHADHDRLVDFDGYRTFAMDPAPLEAPANLPGYSEIAGERILSQIADALLDKGLVEVDADPDIRVRFFLNADERTSQARWDETDFGLGWSDRQRYETADTVHYVEATLVVDVRDMALDRIVWHGWASAEIFKASNNQRLERRAVADLMDLYPPQAD